MTAAPAEVLAAVADPTRRQLLDALARQGPRTASQLAADLPISRQAVAKHLTVLSQAGVVTSARHGRDVRFTLETRDLVAAAGWLTGLAAEWEARLHAIKQIAEEARG